MTSEYEAYTREINGKHFYFVKCFLVLTDPSHCTRILTGYGMHTDLEKACDIAGIKEREQKDQVYTAFEQQQPAPAKVISIGYKKVKGKKIS